MKKLLAALVVILLTGCAAVVKVEGDQVVNERMNVKLSEAWNKLSNYGVKQPYEVWTQDGPSLDHLRFWAGIKSGQALMATPTVPSGQTAPRVPTFTSGMAPDQLVNLFEVLYSVDGSMVKMTKVEPAPFAGEQGVRFEFTIVRKRDDLELRGVGWMAVRKDELYAATFAAPRLAYYAKLLPKVESVVASARIKG
jgi:hypothetical protein